MIKLIENILLGQLTNITGGYVSGLVSWGIDHVNNKIKGYLKTFLMSVFAIIIMSLSTLTLIIFTAIHFSDFNLSSEIFRSILFTTVPLLLFGALYFYFTYSGSNKNTTSVFSEELQSSFTESVNKKNYQQELGTKIKSQDIQIQKLERALELILSEKININDKPHNVA